MPALTVLRLLFSGVFIVVFLYAAWESRNFPSISGMYPLVVSLAGLALATITLFVDLRKWRTSGDVVGSDADTSATAALAARDASVGSAFLRAGRFGLWLIALMLMIYLVGFVAASGIFVLAFLLLESRAKWPLVVAGPLVTIGLLLLLAEAINLFWPDSLLELIS